MEDRIALTTASPDIKGRDPALKPTDKSALYAIAQAAIDVELFTILPKGIITYWENKVIMDQKTVLYSPMYI
jgi:hypothetical protein